MNQQTSVPKNQQTSVPRQQQTTVPKKRLAIVSTFDDLCGIAGYTRSLCTYLDAEFDIEVLDLDQYAMRAKAGRAVQIADEKIKGFCDRFSEFDAVNIQLEYGTLGFYQKDILRRLAMMIDAAPALSVTFHTILPSKPFPRDALRTAFFRIELWNCFAIIAEHRRANSFRKRVYKLLKQAQKVKPLSIIVHTPRDAVAMSLYQGFEHVFDHPLSFVPPELAATIRKKSNTHLFPQIAGLPEKKKIIGVFGFVSEYKGIHTAIRALRHLPDDYHLAIFGGLHPEEIRPRGPVTHPYIERLLGEAHEGQTLIEYIGAQPNTNLSVDLNKADQEKITKSPIDLSSRIHFMGVPDDDMLVRAMTVVDAVVLPYYEVGQASSGPMSMAMDMGARIVAARNQAFLQFSKYHPDRLEFFDIGNHLELAQRLLNQPQDRSNMQGLTHTTQSNGQIYKAAHEVTVSAPVQS